MKERLGVEADRNRIAADIHDGVQGHLISLASQLELISCLAPSDGVRAAGVALEAREVARQGADELRFLVQRMRGPALGDGFVPALRQYADNFCSRNGLNLEFVLVGEPRLKDSEAEGALFRVAQEALNNVAKHAHASHVVVSFSESDGHVSLRIQDDGCGFDQGSVVRHVGFVSMEERLDKIGWVLDLTCEQGHGTSVEAKAAAPKGFTASLRSEVLGPG